jgi:DHA1 family bicyclomycin/chloramphenicol resistance-like MFS transporter
VVGPLSDRLGRRPVVIAGLVLFSLGSLIASLAASPETVILGRILQAGGGATSFVIARTIVHDTYDRGEATTLISYMVMAMVLAPMVASVIGGFMAEHLGWRPIFLLNMAVGVAILAAVWPVLRETNRLAGSGRTFAQILREARALCSAPLFWGHTGAASFASGMFFSFIGVAPYVVEKVMGRPQSDYGLYFLFMSAGYLAGNFFSGRFSARLGPSRMIGLGVLASGLGMALFWMLYGWGHPAAIFMPMMCVTFSNGITLPNATVGAMAVRPEVAGSASGLTGMLQMIVAAGLTAMVGLFESESRLAMTLALSAAWVLSGLSWVVVKGAVGSGQCVSATAHRPRRRHAGKDRRQVPP